MDSRDLRNLSESYSLIEEQSRIDDFCIKWAQKKLAEGFDFSQYTEEEIIEQVSDELLSEQGQRGSGMRYAPANRAAQQFGGFVNFLRGLGSQGTMQGSRSRFNRPSSTTTQPATPVRPTATTVRPTAPAATTPVRPATPAPRPVPTAAAPTPTTPASGAVPDKVTPAAPARRSIAQDLADLRAMRTASQMRQQGKKINGQIATGSAVQAASKSVSDMNKGARQYMQTNSADLFDIVKGYLLDEGATEEEALKLMAVMTEEDRNEIIESSCGGGHSKKKKKKSGY